MPRERKGMTANSYRVAVRAEWKTATRDMTTSREVDVLSRTLIGGARKALLDFNREWAGDQPTSIEFKAALTPKL